MAYHVKSLEKFCRVIAFVLMAGLPGPTATAIGIVVPREPDLAAPQLHSVHATAEISNHLARTRITQEFRNANSRPVEADFYFPVPSGADITDFVLYMNGKPVKGEVLNKETARDTYRNIVRKLKDPGLVEWADKNLFRVRIFPIPPNGTQKLELEISQPLTADQGYFRYSLPLLKSRHGKGVSAVTAKIAVTIHAEEPVRNTYSPSHKVSIDRDSSRSVKVNADASLTDSKSFILYYESTAEDIAASLLTHRTTGDDGYFSLRISPPWDLSTTVPVSHGSRYAFVIDTSGSMAEDGKMAQAQKALRYCVNVLKEHDQFNLIRFSTAVESYQAGLTLASETNRQAALDWIDSLEARGGTNISDALQKTLTQNPDAESPGTTGSVFTVVFITDGLPTVGETSIDGIVKSVEEKSSGNVRIFTFGVGHDVNTRLLDTIAEQTRAASDYVEPEADLEVPVSRFFDKVHRPALFNVDLKIPEAGVSEIYPPQLPDLFYGTELAVYGKYTKATTSPVILSGTIGGEAREFRFEKYFPVESNDSAFIEKLWATRKVAWLLDQVRKHGESSEVRQEVEELAAKYGIVTPYTSYLAMEDKSSERRAAGTSLDRMPAVQSRNTRSSGQPLFSAGATAEFPAAAPAMDLMQESGSMAVNTARRLQVMKSADTIPAATATAPGLRQTVGGKTFTKVDGEWKDSEITGNESNHVKVKYLSDAWFQLTEKFPGIKEYFSLGELVIVKIGPGIVVESGPKGIEFISVKAMLEIEQAILQKK